MKNKIAAVSMAVVAGLGGTLVAATPAHAAWDNCGDTSWVCGYEHTGGGGARVALFTPLGQCTNLSSGWNDRISSVWNRRSYPDKITFWYDSGCNGWSASYSNGRKTDVSVYDNDEFTSWCIGPTQNPSVGCGRY